MEQSLFNYNFYRKPERIKLLFLFLFFALTGITNVNAQVNLSLTSSTTVSTALSGAGYTVQLNYSASSTTGDINGGKIVVDLPDDVYTVIGFVGTEHAPASNFVFSNVAGAKKLTITFVNPLPSGSNGVLSFDLYTKSYTIADSTVVTTTSTFTATGGYTSGPQASPVLIRAYDKLCVAKTLVNGGAVNNPTTYRIYPTYGGSTYASNGTLQASDIVITDSLPAGAQFISAKIYGNGTVSTPVYDAVNNIVTASLPALKAGSFGYDHVWSYQNYYLEVTVQYNSPQFNSGDSVVNHAKLDYTPYGQSPKTITNGQVNAYTGCVSDLIEKTKLVAPVVAASLTKSGSGMVYPGQTFTYDIGFKNTGNVPLDTVQIVENIPSNIRLTGMRIDSWATYVDHGEYQTNTSSGWIVLPAGTVFPGVSSLPTGQYYTKLKFVLKSPYPANTSLSGYNNLTFTAAQEVTSAEGVTNCMDWTSTTIGIPVSRTTCNSSFTLQPRPTTSAISFTSSHTPGCAGAQAIGTTFKFTGTMVTDPGYTDATDPICAFFVPTGFDYKTGSLVFTANTSGITVVPAMEIVKNYITIGGQLKDMYRFTFPTGTVMPHGTNFSLSISAIATNRLPSGINVGADFIATAGNSSKNTSGNIYDNTFTDTPDWDLDGNKTETFKVENTEYYSCGLTITPVSAMESVKWVKGQLDSVYSKYPAVASSVPGGIADYKLVIKNKGNVVMKNVVLIDLLPRVGDSGLIDRSPRLSQWAPNLAAPIQAPTGINVYYSTVANPCMSELNITTTGCVNAAWSLTAPTDLTQVKAVKIDFGTTTLNGGDSLVFSWPMRVPVNAPVNNETAYNSFAFTATRADNNTALIAAEPTKVGIKVKPGKPAYFGDYVWMDTNQDGIQDDNEGGVDGIVVKLFIPAIAGQQNPATDSLVAFTITGNGGKYLFSGLPEGDYYAVFELPNGQSISPKNAAGSYFTNDSNGDPTTYNGLPAAISEIIHLTLAENDLTIDLGIHCSSSFTPSVTAVQNTYAGGSVTLTATGGSSYSWEGPHGFTATTASITINNVSTADTGTYTVKISSGTLCAVTLTTGIKISNTASVGDKVWRDDDADGIQDAGEPGMAGVSVTLYNNSGIIVGSTVTDAYGAYLFDNLQPGDYAVKFTAPVNYSFTTSTGTDTDNATNSDANMQTGMTSTFTLVAGQEEKDIDAGFMFTQPTAPGSIGDHVWYDTNGDGNQDTDEPGLAGVTVTLYNAATGNTIAITTTDAKGNYVFNDVPVGTYQVAFTPLPGTVLTTNNGGTTTDNNSTNSDADPVTGRTGNIVIATPGTVITGIDAGIKDDPKGSIGDFVWNDLNHNGLQDAGEPGIAGVTVKLYTAGADGWPGGGNDVLVATTTTDINGIYQFNGLDPNKYFVTATVPAGYTTTIYNAGTNDYIDNDFTNNVNYIGVKTTGAFTLSSNQTYTAIDFGLYNTTTGLSSIGDKVWADIDADGIQDAGENGMPGITVSLLDGNGAAVNNPATGKPYVIVTDANGNYTFADLPAGNYQVKFSNLPADNSFSPAAKGSTSIDSDADPLTGITPVFSLAAGENKTDIDAGVIQQVPAGKASIGNSVWADANNNGIQDTGEQGVPGITVALYYDSNNDGIINGTESTIPYKTTTTDASGSYIFTGLDAGKYQVGFISSSFPSGYSLQPGKNDQGTDDSKDSDADPSTGLTTVITLKTGEDNLTVDAALYNPSATNSIGDKVWADTNGNGKQDPGEPGVPGVTVNLLDNTGKLIASVVTDNNGNYNFGNVPNGTYTVQVITPAGFTFTTKDATDDDNDSDMDAATGTSLPLVLTGGTNLTNVDAGLITARAAVGNYVWYDANSDGVQDATEQGISGVTVTIYRSGFGLDGIAGNSDDELPVATTITDANGAYLFSNLLPGNYTMSFTTVPTGLTFTQQNSPGDNNNNTNSDANATGVTPTFTLSAGEVDMTIDAGLKPLLLGSVGDLVWNDTNKDGIRDATESKVPGIMVTLKDNMNNTVGATFTNGDGNFLFTGVTAGTGYTLTFSHLTGTNGFTTQNATGSTSSNNSDANQVSGITGGFTITGGQKTPNIDAGIYPYSTLAVSGITLQATLYDNNLAEISWDVKGEANVDHYEIERSTTNSNFITVGNRKSDGKMHDENSYLFHDNITSLHDIGSIYYRIKVVDVDGKISYSNIIIVRLTNLSKIIVAPNPIKDKLMINFTATSDTKLDIKLMDINGRTMYRETHNAVKGENKILIQGTGKYSAGTYLLQIDEDNGMSTIIRLLK